MNKEEADKKGKARVNLYMDKELIKKAKFKALEREMTLTELLEEALKKVV